MSLTLARTVVMAQALLAATVKPNSSIFASPQVFPIDTISLTLARQSHLTHKLARWLTDLVNDQIGASPGLLREERDLSILRKDRKVLKTQN